MGDFRGLTSRDFGKFVRDIFHVPDSISISQLQRICRMLYVGLGKAIATEESCRYRSAAISRDNNSIAFYRVQSRVGFMEYTSIIRQTRTFTLEYKH
jgi:hypothetical protein